MKTYKIGDDPIVVPRFNEGNGFYTTLQRSLLMSKIKSKNTKPEIRLRKSLWKLGYRYRINSKKLPGKPDIVFLKYNLVVFVDGEFWHGYDWDNKKGRLKTNRAFWIPKIERNMQRDIQNSETLRAMGLNVIRFWEHQIKKDLIGCIKVIVPYLHQ